MAYDPVLREVHEIRDKISERIKDMSPEEYSEFFSLTSKEKEESMLKMGYKWVPCEDTPGCMILIRVERQ